MLCGPILRRFLRALPPLNGNHNFSHLIGCPLETVQKCISSGLILLQSLAGYGVNFFRFPIGLLGIIQVLKIVLGEHPVRCPTSNYDRLFVLDCSIQHGRHRGT
ncbi:hypothetical protein D3C85_1436110 [compost metagenome]